MMYHFGVHLLYASMVGSAAWVLTSIRGTSATTKYWIWVVTAVNFVVPSGALIDKLWAPHLTWSEPLRAIVGLVRYLTQGRTAVVLVVIWINGRTYHARAVDLAFAHGALRGSCLCRPS
jgi:hypothetical protein